jgi:hypothetical protein
MKKKHTRHLTATLPFDRMRLMLCLMAFVVCWHLQFKLQRTRKLFILYLTILLVKKNVNFLFFVVLSYTRQWNSLYKIQTNANIKIKWFYFRNKWKLSFFYFLNSYNMKFICQWTDCINTRPFHSSTYIYKGMIDVHISSIMTVDRCW